MPDIEILKIFLFFKLKTFLVFKLAKVAQKIKKFNNNILTIITNIGLSLKINPLEVQIV